MYCESVFDNCATVFGNKIGFWPTSNALFENKCCANTVAETVAVILLVNVSTKNKVFDVFASRSVNCVNCEILIVDIFYPSKMNVPSSVVK